MNVLATDPHSLTVDQLCDAAAGARQPDGTIDAGRFVAGLVRGQFELLAVRWREGVAGVSSPTRRYAHPGYRAIVALGLPVVPHLLREMTEQQTDRWADALREILGDGPVIPREDQGRTEPVRAAWLAWARARTLGA